MKYWKNVIKQSLQQTQLIKTELAIVHENVILKIIDIIKLLVLAEV